MSGQSMPAPDTNSGTTRIPENKGFHIGHRGVAMYKDWLFFLTPDAHLRLFNAKDGTVRWNVVVADSQNEAIGPLWRR